MSVFDFEAEGEQVETLRHLLSHPAWQGFFVTKLIDARNKAMSMLVWPSEDRKRDQPDDYLRARIQLIDELLELGPTYIREWDVQVLRAASEEEGLGRMAPS